MLATRGNDDNKPSASASAGPALSTGAISFSQAKAAGAHRPDVPAGLRHVDRSGRDPDELSRGVLRQPAGADRRRTPRASPTTASTSSSTSRRIRTRCSTTSRPRSTTTTRATRSQATYEGYNALYQAFYQTYGRKVNLKFLRASGESTDAVAARADAVKAAEETGRVRGVGWPGADAGVDRRAQRTRRRLPRLLRRRHAAARTCSPSARRPTRAAISSPSTSASDWRTSPRSSPVTRPSRARTACSVTCSSRPPAATEQANADKLRDKLSAAGREPRPAHPVHARPGPAAGAGRQRHLAAQAGRRHVGHLPRRPGRAGAFTQEATRRTTSPSGSSVRVRSSTRRRSAAPTTSSSGRTRSASRR